MLVERGRNHIGVHPDPAHLAQRLQLARRVGVGAGEHQMEARRSQLFLQPGDDVAPEGGVDPPPHQQSDQIGAVALQRTREDVRHEIIAVDRRLNPFAGLPGELVLPGFAVDIERHRGHRNPRFPRNIGQFDPRRHLPSFPV